MVPRVCILGTTLGDAERLLDVLCKENPDDIYRRRVGVGIMNDGTELIAMSVQDRSCFYGRTFDYVFYERDRLAEYCLLYGDVIEYLQQRCLSRSEIPEKFQWCEINMED